MDVFMKQYQHAYSCIQVAISNRKNIILCGPEKSGKTFLRKQFQSELQEKKYDTFLGLEEYLSYNRMNGRSYGLKDQSYVIEELIENKTKLADIFDEDFMYIELIHKFPEEL